MSAERLRSALAEGGRLRGVFVKLGETEVIDLVAASQDFVVLDLEHSAMDERTAMRCARHAEALGFAALVRVASVDAGQINRMLEAGAAGIQLSTVTNADQVVELRAATQYAPLGRRSVSLGHAAAGYGALGLEQHIARQAAAPPLVVVQLETDLPAAELEAILAAGPDVAFIGTTDLLVALGLSRERLQTTVSAYAEAVRAAGIPLGGFRLTEARVAYDVHATDVQLLSDALARNSPPS